MIHATRSAILSICALALLAGTASAGPLNPAQVPASAELVVHVDVDLFKASRLHKIVGAEIDRVVNELAAPLDKQGVPLTAADLTAVSGVTFWAEGSNPERGALIANGVNAGRLLRALTKLPNFKIEKHGGYVLTRIRVDGDDTYVGATRSAVVVADHHDSVTRTLDAMTRKAPSLAGSKVARRLGQSGGMLVAATFGSAIADKIRKEANSPMFRDIGLTSGSVYASEKGSTLLIRGVLDHSTAAGASKLVALGQAGLTMLSMGADDPDIAALANGIKLSASGTQATVSVRVPYRLIRKASSGKLNL